VGKMSGVSRVRFFRRVGLRSSVPLVYIRTYDHNRATRVPAPQSGAISSKKALAAHRKCRANRSFHTRKDWSGSAMGERKGGVMTGGLSVLLPKTRREHILCKIPGAHRRANLAGGFAPETGGADIRPPPRTA